MSGDLKDEKESAFGNGVTFTVSQLKIARSLSSCKVGRMGNEAPPPALKMADMGRVRGVPAP